MTPFAPPADQRNRCPVHGLLLPHPAIPDAVTCRHERLTITDLPGPDTYPGAHMTDYNPTDNELRGIVNGHPVDYTLTERGLARLVLRERETWSRRHTILSMGAPDYRREVEKAETLASEWKAYEWKARVERDEARARAGKAEADRDHARAALARVEAFLTDIERRWTNIYRPVVTVADVRAAIGDEPPAATAAADHCETCQGRNRHTTDMVCMDCGRDYMPDDGTDESPPGVGWKRLMGAWREQAKKAETDLAAARAAIGRVTDEEAARVADIYGPGKAQVRVLGRVVDSYLKVRAALTGTTTAPAEDGIAAAAADGEPEPAAVDLGPGPGPRPPRRSVPRGRIRHVQAGTPPDRRPVLSAGHRVERLGGHPVNTERAEWLLRHPLNRADMALDPAYREALPQPGGALLTAILAVDR